MNTTNQTSTQAPAEGTVGIGVGHDEEWGFHSIIWFPADAKAEAESFATEHGYDVKEGVRL